MIHLNNLIPDKKSSILKRNSTGGSGPADTKVQEGPAAGFSCFKEPLA